MQKIYNCLGQDITGTKRKLLREEFAERGPNEDILGGIQYMHERTIADEVLSGRLAEVDGYPGKQIHRFVEVCAWHILPDEALFSHGLRG